MDEGPGEVIATSAEAMLSLVTATHAGTRLTHAVSRILRVVVASGESHSTQRKLSLASDTAVQVTPEPEPEAEEA